MFTKHKKNRNFLNHIVDFLILKGRILGFVCVCGGGGGGVKTQTFPYKKILVYVVPWVRLGVGSGVRGWNIKKLQKVMGFCDQSWNSPNFAPGFSQMCSFL